MEVLCREVMSGRDWNKLWFIEVADEKDPASEFIEPLQGHDPPQELLKRLADLPVNVKPASQAVWLDSNAGIKDRTTGEAGYLAIVCILRWIDADTAEVLYNDYHSGLAASGGKAIVRRHEGKWVLESKGRWFS